MSDKSRCVVLLSGGLDSATVLAIASEMQFDIHAITFWYGQRHAAELEAARTIAQAGRVERHSVFEIDLRQVGGSSLTDNIAVPKGRSIAEMCSCVPSTYVPARNTIFLSVALAYGEVDGAFDIFLGANALDHAGYPDCRPEYISAFERMANLATKSTIEGHRRWHIHTPLIDMSKSAIISKGLSLGVDYSHTVSCYEASSGGSVCGNCDACRLRGAAFAQNGIEDPALCRLRERVTQ